MFTREKTDQMGKALSIYGYGVTLGCILAGFSLPFVANWLIPSYELTLPAYPYLTITIVQTGVMAGFVWGALCGWLSGIFVNPDIAFNKRPQLSRLLGALFVIVPALIIPFRQPELKQAIPFEVGVICLLYMACSWLSVNLVSRYFVDKDPYLSKYKRHLSELTPEQIKNL